MKTSRLTRIFFIVAATLLVLVAAAFAGLHYATKVLKTQVEAALGADSEIGDISVGWSQIVAQRVTIHAPQGWPAKETLRAEKIVIVPDLRGLLSDRSHVHINSISVDDAYLSVLRTREGKLRLLPSLLEKEKPVAKADGAASSPSGMPVTVDIGTVQLHGGAVEFFDASIRHPAHKMRLEKLEATVKDLRVPDLTTRTHINLDGIVKGVRRDGKLALNGWITLASKDSQIETSLSGVDLLVLQPYLIKTAETGVKRGTLDLKLQSAVHNKQLHAPGTVTLTDLELSERGGSFMGIPRQLVITALANRKNQISVQFTLNGNLDDPKFSLNDSFAKNIATSVAGLLGISIEDLTKNLGSAAGNVGSVLKKLLGK